MTKRSRIVGFGSAGLLVLAGAVLIVLSAGEFGQVLAMALLGLGFLLAVSLLFAEVGFSEDRERDAERERSRRRRRSERAPATQRRPRLERMRGRSRRLR